MGDFQRREDAGGFAGKGAKQASEAPDARNSDAEVSDAAQKVASQAEQADAPLVVPRELPGFKRVVEAMAKAKAQADRLPAEITDEGVSGEASDALKALKHVRQDIDKERKAAKAPFDQASGLVQSTFVELLNPVAGIEQSIKARLLAFNQAQQKAHEAERKRQEKLARERQAREDAKAKKEERAARHKPAPPPPPPPPSGARGANAKTSVRTVMKYEIINEAELPDEYVTRKPDRRKIKAAVDAGLVVPGTRVWSEDEVATR